jgi:hypothetical protein
VVVAVLVLVDVLVLVLVLADIDVDRQPLTPPRADTCSIESAAIATDCSKTILRGYVELPIARGSAMRGGGWGHEYEHEHEHVNEHEYDHVYVYAYVYVRCRRWRTTSTSTMTTSGAATEKGRAEHPKMSRPSELSGALSWERPVRAS